MLQFWQNKANCIARRRPAVAAALAEEQGKRLAAIDFSAEDVLHELAAIARGNVLDYLRFDKSGEPAIDLSGLDRTRSAALSEIRVERRKGRQSFLIRTHDKNPALDRLARSYGLYASAKAGRRNTPQGGHEGAFRLGT